MDPYAPPLDPDEDNPYAPPRSAEAPKPALGQLIAIPFTVGDVFDWTWSIYKGRFWACLSVVWGVVLVNWMLALFQNVLQLGLQANVKDPVFSSGLQFAVIFVNFVIQVWLGIGVTIGLLKIARGDAVALEDVFSGGRFLWRTLVASLLCGLIMLGALFVPIFVMFALVPMLQGNSSVVAVIVFPAVCVISVFAFLFLMARLLQFYYLIIDRNARIVESLQVAWKMTKNRASTIVLLILGQFAIVLAGFLAFCVGLVFALPFISLLQVVTYLALRGSAAPAPVADAWEEDL
jgi:hypothetical protein